METKPYLGLLISLEFALFLISAEATLAVPAPIVVGASQNWDGNDGPWSSFPIQVGTPAQDVRVLISTSGHQNVFVIPGGCIATDPSNCNDLRGGFFEVNASSTWEVNTANLSSNIYPLLIDQQLGYSANGELGFDDVTLGWQGAGGPALRNQTVAGFEDKDFYLGFFGLTPRASNFTSFDDPIPSYMQNLRTENLIPSTSWSYTAGNQYRLNEVLGSLVLGGYDTSKFIPNDVSFPFSNVDAQDLTLQLEAITMVDSNTTGTSLLPTSIPAFLDSSLPYIWLPTEACTLFENAFGITWDDETELYLLNSTQRTALISQNANITFTLGNLTAGATVNITLPYAAFDLTVSSPIVNSSTPYFPLKRATNSTQYTLGRTFFQEAYVTADYDRSNFSVSQCSWVAEAQENIVAILPPSNNSSVTPSQEPGSSKNSSHVPTGAIAGGAAGGVLVVIAAIALLLFFFCIKPRKKRAAEAEASSAAAFAASQAIELKNMKSPEFGEATETTLFIKAELDSGQEQRAEMEDPIKNQWRVETEGSAVAHEMDAKKNLLPVEADGQSVEVHEMAAREEVAAEMMGHHDSIIPAPPSRWSWATSPDEISPPPRWTPRADGTSPPPEK